MRLSSLVGLVALATVSAGSARADEPVLSGSVRGGLWTSDRRLSDSDGRWVQGLWLNGTYRATETLRLVMDGHGWAETRRSDRPGGIVGRDAYVGLDLGAVDLRLGLQSFAWGRADRVNPTDVLSRRDATLLVTSAEEQRQGLPALSVDWAVRPDTRLVAVSQLFRPSTLPTVIADSAMPQVADRAGRPEWALRLDHVGDGVDWSVMTAQVYDKQRWLVVVAQADGTMGGMREHPRQQVWGGDWAATFGDYGMRAEAAYTHVLDGAATTAGGKSPNLFAVAGIDRDWGEDGSYNVSVQYLARWNRDFHDPGAVADSGHGALLSAFAIANAQTAAVQQVLSLRLARQPFDGALTWETVVSLDLGDGGFWLQPALSWRLNDRVILKTGGDLYRGDARRSHFGSLRGNTLAFAELRWLF